MKMTKTSLAALATVILTAGTITADARELRIASTSPPNYELYNPVFTTFMEELERLTDGALTAKHFGLEVVNLRNAVSSLESGIVDIGNFLPSYTPADFPNAALISELSPLGQIGAAMMPATVEYFVTCEDCQQEFARKGFVYTGGVSTPSYEVLTTDKAVHTLADIKGLRLRSPGTAFSLWISAMGGIPTEISFNEEYEALQGGLVDGTVAPPANLTGNRLAEVTNFYTPISVGTFNVTSSFTVRQQLWQSLPEDQRAAIVAAAVAGTSKNEYAMRQTGDRALADFYAGGAELAEPAEDLQQRVIDFQDAAIAVAIENGITRYNIPDAQEKVDRFVALVAKWNAIIEPIQNDTDAIADAVNAEIWSKVDLSTYGF